jgi:hypothetical protein
MYKNVLSVIAEIDMITMERIAGIPVPIDITPFVVKIVVANHHNLCMEDLHRCATRVNSMIQGRLHEDVNVAYIEHIEDSMIGIKVCKKQSNSVNIPISKYECAYIG